MFCFAYLKQDVTICLRCQIRLVTGSKLILKRQTLRTPPWIRYLSSTSIRYLATDSHLPRFFFPEFRASHRPDQLVFRPTSPLIRFRRIRLGQQVVSLGIDTLGEPAQIRILREKEDRNRRNAIVSESNENVFSQVKSREDILDAINADKDGKDADPFDNLEDLRKNFIYSSGVVGEPTLGQCREIAQEIHDGFTSPQLECYLRKTKSSQAAEHKALERRFEDELFVRSAWFIGVSKFPHHAIQRLGSDDLDCKGEHFILGLEPLSGQKQSKKQRLVEDVLRKSWRLRCKEEKVIEGEIDIRLRPQYLALLLNHRTDIFGKISEQLGTKIDISQSQCIIRITGDYNTCLEVCEMIYVMLGDIRTEDLDLQHFGETQRSTLASSSLLGLDASEDKILLERIEQLTSTHLEPMQSSADNSQITKLRVYHMGPDQTDLEDVQRLVIQVVSPDVSKKIQLQYDETATSATMLRAPVEVGTTLPWTERVTKWIRWKVGSKAKSTAVDERDVKRRFSIAVLDPVKHQNIMENIARFLFKDRSLEVDKGFEEFQTHRNGYWDPWARHVVNATLGHIAYPASPNLEPPNEPGPTSNVFKRKSARQMFSETMHARRILVTSLAENFSTLKHLASQQDPFLRNELHVLLKPNKVEDDGQVDISAFPDLHLCIAIGNSSHYIELSEARLIVDERESDLLLLREVADIRFKSSSFISGTSNIDPKIQQFVADSNLDVWASGGRLKTPSRLQISIPSFAIKSHTTKESTNLIPLSKNDVAVEYAFSRLEYHSHMSVLYQGLNTSYSTIEGGKTGGRRNEICLEPPNMEVGVNGILATDAFSAFFNTVREYVIRMGMSAVDIEKDLEEMQQMAGTKKLSAPPAA